MSESRIRRLMPVVDMALEEERKAATVLGQCQQQLDEAQNRLRDLEYYCTEYAKGWTQRGEQGVGREWLMNYQRFMAQMEVALDELSQRAHGQRGNNP